MRGRQRHPVPMLSSIFRVVLEKVAKIEQHIVLSNPLTSTAPKGSCLARRRRINRNLRQSIVNNLLGRDEAQQLSVMGVYKERREQYRYSSKRWKVSSLIVYNILSCVTRMVNTQRLKHSKHNTIEVVYTLSRYIATFSNDEAYYNMPYDQKLSSYHLSLSLDIIYNILTLFMNKTHS